MTEEQFELAAETEEKIAALLTQLEQRTGRGVDSIITRYVETPGYHRTVEVSLRDPYRLAAISWWAFSRTALHSPCGVGRLLPSAVSRDD